MCMQESGVKMYGDVLLSKLPELWFRRLFRWQCHGWNFGWRELVGILAHHMQLYKWLQNHFSNWEKTVEITFLNRI